MNSPRVPHDHRTCKKEYFCTHCRNSELRRKSFFQSFAPSLETQGQLCANACFKTWTSSVLFELSAKMTSTLSSTMSFNCRRGVTKITWSPSRTKCRTARRTPSTS